MTRWLTLALLLACVAPVGAAHHEADEYRLKAKATQHLGQRWYLMRYQPVTLEPGQVAGYWLALDSCPGGVDHVFALYVNPTGPGAWDYRGPGWGWPIAYGVYRPASSVTIANHSEAPMTFKVKVSVRCEE